MGSVVWGLPAGDGKGACVLVVLYCMCAFVLLHCFIVLCCVCVVLRVVLCVTIHMHLCCQFYQWHVLPRPIFRERAFVFCWPLQYFLSLSFPLSCMQTMPGGSPPPACCPQVLPAVHHLSEPPKLLAVSSNDQDRVMGVGWTMKAAFV